MILDKLLNLFRKKPSPEEFWAWFAANQQGLSDAASDFIKKQLAPRFNRAFPDLDITISHEHPIVVEISADGIRSRIPEVMKAVRSAPKRDWFKVVAFRQPTDIDQVTIELRGKIVSLAEMRILPERVGPDTLEIDVFVPVPQNTPKDVLSHLGFLALDHAIGEYPMMMHVTGAGFHPIDQAPAEAISIKEFAASLPPTRLPE